MHLSAGTKCNVVAFQPLHCLFEHKSSSLAPPASSRDSGRLTVTFIPSESQRIEQQVMKDNRTFKKKSRTPKVTKALPPTKTRMTCSEYQQRNETYQRLYQYHCKYSDAMMQDLDYTQGLLDKVRVLLDSRRDYKDDNDFLLEYHKRIAQIRANIKDIEIRWAESSRQLDELRDMREGTTALPAPWKQIKMMLSWPKKLRKKLLR